LVFYKLFCSLLQVIGWSMWFAEYLFLERSWAKDEKTLRSRLFPFILRNLNLTNKIGYFFRM
jgi:1-acyl-sn-glycerol-3-phosphate acyltransferase